jgi:hypothetical protein
MSVLAALLLQAVADPIYEDPFTRVIQFLGRHQNDDGSWGEPPPDCCCIHSISMDLALRVVPDDETIRCFEDLREDLPSDLPSERERAEKGLFQLGLPGVPLLQECWTDPDPEVRWRCRKVVGDLWHRDPLVHAAFRETGCPGTEDFELKATGLALLALLGGGYSHLSRDEYLDPMRPQRRHQVGVIIKKGLQWMMERQRPDGSFEASHPEGNVYPALALVEAYGHTGFATLKEPAAKAIEFVEALKSEDPRILLWKEFVAEAARMADLPARANSAASLIRAFEKGTSTIDVSAVVLLSSFAKRPADAARAQLLDLPSDSWTAEERFYGMLAVNRVWGIRTPERSRWRERHPSEWKKQQILAMQCDRGGWPEETGRFEERLMASLYTTIASEEYYAYAYALFALP